MTLVLFAFLSVFVFVGSAALLLFYRDAVLQRLSSVISPRKGGFAEMRRAVLAQPASSLGTLVEPFERALPRSSEEVSITRRRLIRAGYRKENAVNIFYGAKFLVPVGLSLLALLSGVYEYLGTFFVFAVCLGVGFLIPDFWLGNRIAARQLAIRVGLPDVLDLLVICIEAGLGLDQAMTRAADDLKTSHPALADEMGLLLLETRAGHPRVEAWKHFAERTDVDSVRALVSMLLQADQYGTSIAKALRQFSDTLRIQRRQDAEEQAAKTTVKLVFPLVFFIFPSIFLVLMGPSIIVLSDAFDKYFSE